MTTTENPFAETEPTDAELFADESDGVEAEEENDADVEGTGDAELEDPDVDTPQAEDTVEAPKEEAKPAAKASTSTRPSVPEGYTTPVQYAKMLTDVLHEEGLLDSEKVIAPQVAYSYIKNSQGGKNPFPIYSAGGRDWLLKLDDETKKPEEGFQWWRDKIARVAAGKQNSAAKAAKKAAAKPEGEAKAEPTGPVEEAE